MKYTYKRTELLKNKDIEVVLIDWKPGESSCPHQHGNCSGIVKVLKGKVYEIPIKKKGSKFVAGRKRYFKEGECFTEEALGAHKVGNDSETDAQTMHIYLPMACNKEVKI